MEKLTNREHDVLVFIFYFKSEYGYAPTLREIADGLYLSSHYTVQRHVEHLKEKGYITYSEKVSRSIRVTFQGYALLLA